jgi:hypothetical protein
MIGQNMLIDKCPECSQSVSLASTTQRKYCKFCGWVEPIPDVKNIQNSSIEQQRTIDQSQDIEPIANTDVKNNNLKIIGAAVVIAALAFFFGRNSNNNSSQKNENVSISNNSESQVQKSALPTSNPISTPTSTPTINPDATLAMTEILNAFQTIYSKSEIGLNYLEHADELQDLKVKYDTLSPRAIAEKSYVSDIVSLSSVIVMLQEAHLYWKEGIKNSNPDKTIYAFPELKTRMTALGVPSYAEEQVEIFRNAGHNIARDPSLENRVSYKLLVKALWDKSESEFRQIKSKY